MIPYTIITPEGKKLRVTKTKCLIINDIHQHIRVVHLLDQVGLNFDVISVVLDKYRERLDSLPKPSRKIFRQVKDRCIPSPDGNGNWCNRLQLIKWRSEHLTGRDGGNYPLNFWAEREMTIKGVFQQIYHSNLSPFVSGDLRTPFRSIPRGFKGSVMENYSLIERLNNTRFFNDLTEDGVKIQICRPSRNGRTKPFNMKLINKSM